MMMMMMMMCLCVRACGVSRETTSVDVGQGDDRGQGEGDGHVGLTLIADVRRSTVNVVDTLLDTLVILHVSYHTRNKS